jgi:hypothetical protein
MATFTLRDVTTTTWTTLSNPPDGLSAPPEPSALCLQDVMTCKKGTADRKNDKPQYARNRDWNPRLLPRITSPISWPFLQQPIFTTDRSTTHDVLNLKFVAEPPAGFTVKIYSVTFTKAATAPPHFIGVAYPMDLDIEKPPPFLVHYKHIPGQDPASTLFKYFNPLGYDWLSYEIWNWFVYNAWQEPGVVGLRVNMPFLANWQSSFGFCYQLRQASKQYVLVLPQISRVFESGTGKLREYQLYSAATLREILLAIQKDILPIKDETLSHVAISANSSGCNVLSTFLTENVAAVKRDATIATFMNDEFNELFVFDPPEDSGDAMVTSLDGWRRLSSSRSDSKGKCVRFYTHSYTKNFATLAGGTDPFKRNVAGFWESPTKTTSLAYLPFLRDLDDIWAHTYHEILPHGLMPVSNFVFVHHVIPALFLTDAASRTLYV